MRATKNLDVILQAFRDGLKAGVPKRELLFHGLYGFCLTAPNGEVLPDLSERETFLALRHLGDANPRTTIQAAKDEWLDWRRDGECYSICVNGAWNESSKQEIIDHLVSTGVRPAMARELLRLDY